MADAFAGGDEPQALPSRNPSTPANEVVLLQFRDWQNWSRADGAAVWIEQVAGGYTLHSTTRDIAIAADDDIEALRSNAIATYVMLPSETKWPFW